MHGRVIFRPRARNTADSLAPGPIPAARRRPPPIPSSVLRGPATASAIHPGHPRRPGDGLRRYPRASARCRPRRPARPGSRRHGNAGIAALAGPPALPPSRHTRARLRPISRRPRLATSLCAMAATATPAHPRSPAHRRDSDAGMLSLVASRCLAGRGSHCAARPRGHGMGGHSIGDDQRTIAAGAVSILARPPRHARARCPHVAYPSRCSRPQRRTGVCPPRASRRCCRFTRSPTTACLRSLSSRRVLLALLPAASLRRRLPTASIPLLLSLHSLTHHGMPALAVPGRLILTGPPGRGAAPGSVVVRAHLQRPWMVPPP
jgi:hypothetical protein